MELGSKGDKRFSLREARLELSRMSCIISAFGLQNAYFGAQFLKFLIILRERLHGVKPSRCVYKVIHTTGSFGDGGRGGVLVGIDTGGSVTNGGCDGDVSRGGNDNGEDVR